MPGEIQLLDDDSGNDYIIKPDANGDLLIQRPDGTTVLKYDKSADQFTTVSPFSSLTADDLTTNTSFTDPGGTKHTGTVGGSDPLKVGITSEWHYNEAGGKGGAADVPSGSTIKSNLDTIIDDFNDTFKPDLVFVTGDMADADVASGMTQLTNWLSTITDYFKNSGGSAGTGVDAPVHYLLGNHEYGFAGSGDMQNVYDVLGYANLGETWEAIDTNGLKLFRLNTSWTSTDKTTNKNDHKIPDSANTHDEMSFVSTQLGNAADVGRPVVPFVHVPLSLGDGTSYDQTENQADLLDDLHQSGYFTAGFAGHAHHDDPWDRIVEEIDRNGHSWLITCTPNYFDGDSTTVPYQKVTITPGGGIRSKASYDNTRYQNQWQFGSGQLGGKEQFANDGRFYKYFPRFASTNLFGTVFDGGGSISIQPQGILRMSSGASSGNSFVIRMIPQANHFGDLDWNRPIRLRINANLNSTNTDRECYLAVGKLDGGNTTARHIGIKNTGANTFGTVADGTTESTVDLGNVTMSWDVLWHPGEAVEYYLGDAFANPGAKFNGRITSNLPSGSTSADQFFRMAVKTNAATDQSFDVNEWGVTYGQLGETLPLQRPRRTTTRA